VRRIVELQLGADGAVDPGSETVESDEWRIADQVGDVVGDVHGHLMISSERVYLQEPKRQWRVETGAPASSRQPIAARSAQAAICTCDR
jgi:hypothetical protein